MQPSKYVGLLVTCAAGVNVPLLTDQMSLCVSADKAARASNSSSKVEVLTCAAQSVRTADCC